MSDPRRKNVSREIRDIRFPTSHVPDKSAAAEQPVRRIRPVSAPPKPPIRPRRPRRAHVRPLAIFAAAMIVLAVAAGIFWHRGTLAQADRLRNLLARALHVQDVNVPSGFDAGDGELPTSLGGWMSRFKDIFTGYGGFQSGSFQALAALESAARNAEELPKLFLRRDGAGFAAALAGLRDSLGSLHGAMQKISAGGSQASVFDFSSYLAYAPDIKRAQAAADRLLALFQAPGEHHFLVFFGNSAELRPGGGFLGSFGDVTFGDSEIRGITVHDVNEVDRGLAANIVPPRQMQGLVGRWRAADANWFFDYPASAEKTLQLMGRSSFYASSTLDGAILISPQVVQDLLDVTGPIELSGGRTVAADTVIRMIQSEVQAGQANGAEAPKAILAELLDPLTEKLQALDDEAAAKLFAAARNWIRHKDVAVFARDPELAQILAYYHLDGGLFVLPQEFSGDYLAAVNANVGGGKSDAFIVDDVEVVSDLRTDGLIQNRVTVVRTSQAGPSEEWWYQVTNQDNLRVFTPPGVSLTSAGGMQARKITPRSTYGEGWETDPDLAALESTLAPAPGFPGVSQFREFDKNVFAAWLATPAGGTSALTMEYRRALKAPFRDGQHYTFIFERQSGAEQSLHAVLNAPPGFVWKESGVSKYEYLNLNAPGRVMLQLTLREI